MTLSRVGWKLEVELRAKLQRSRIISRGHFSKVRISRIRIDGVKLRVVESIERLESHFKTWTLTGSEREGLKQR
jgi:hypothetical protein